MLLPKSSQVDGRIFAHVSLALHEHLQRLALHRGDDLAVVPGECRRDVPLGPTLQRKGAVLAKPLTHTDVAGDLVVLLAQQKLLGLDFYDGQVTWGWAWSGTDETVEELQRTLRGLVAVTGWRTALVFGQSYLVVTAVNVVGEAIPIAVRGARVRGAMTLGGARLVGAKVLMVSDAISVSIRATVEVWQAALREAVVLLIQDPVTVKVPRHRTAIVLGQPLV